MDDLPLDLVYEILIRLPATTLGNTARHVCRSWRSIIADPYFIDHHYTRSVSQEDAKTLLFQRDMLNYNRGLVMYTTDRRLEPIRPKHRLPQDISKENTLNILVCNGLILYIYTKDEVVLNFYVYNPIIDLSITLPPMRILVKGTEYHTSGFGYDSIKKDYKVVLVFDNFKDENGHKLYLYCCTINDGTKKNETKYYYCWREVGNINEGVYGYEGLFVGGKLHWFLYPLIFEAKILSFDLNTESLKIETFNTGDDLQILGCKLLGELNGGKLCVYVDNHNEESDWSTVWVKKEDHECENSNWVELSDMRSSVRCVSDYCGYWKDDLFVYHGKGNTYVVMNKRSEIVDVIDYFGGFFLSRFIPTLLSLSSTESLTQQDQNLLEAKTRTCNDIETSPLTLREMGERENSRERENAGDERERERRNRV